LSLLGIDGGREVEISQPGRAANEDFLPARLKRIFGVDGQFRPDCKPECKPNKKPLDNLLIIKRLALFSVVMDGIEPPTQGFSVLCSTD
jgi:hypothetical protein